MPILIKEYEWSQDESIVSLSLDLHSSNKIDVLMTSSYIKINFIPYLFEAFLCEPICPKTSSYKINDGKILLSLKKQFPEKWETFSLKLCKEVARDARSIAMKEHEESEIETQLKKKEERMKVRNLAIGKQIELNEQKLKKQKQKLEKEKDNFFLESSEEKKELRLRTSSSCSEGGYEGDIEEILCSSSSTINENLNDSSHRKCKKKDFKNELPPVRSSNTIKIQMTPRSFQTPRRESSAKDEEEILKKTSEVNGCNAENIDVLSQKASELFKAGDIPGCVNALSEAIKLAPLKASLYSNRAAGHLATHSYQLAIEDCTQALELMTPPSKENEKSRLLCHIRRGTALIQLKNHYEGLEEYHTAFKLDPNNESLKQDIKVIEYFMATSTDDTEETSDTSEESSAEDEEENEKNSLITPSSSEVDEESESASR